MPILTDQERIGTLLGGRYRIDAILGRGGMGVVFKAHREPDRLPVAVKLLRPELAQSDPQFAKRFVREARAAAAVRHPNVVEVIDIAEDGDGTIYQVLELLEGETLREHLNRKGALSLEGTLDILMPVMHALEAAHEAGIVHRDLKPDNVFLARQPSGEAIPTLLDFGIAKVLDTQGGSFATHTGSILGTPAYMAPEQASGAREQGPAIDVWAMGIIVFECLTGAPPFTGSSPAFVMLRIMTEAPRALDAVLEGFPAAVARVVERALARGPRERYPEMGEFRRALRDACERSGVHLPPEGRPSTSRVVSIAPTAQRAGAAVPVDVDAETAADGLGAVRRQMRAAAAASELDSAPIHVSIAEPEPRGRRSRTLLWGALGGLLMLAVGTVLGLSGGTSSSAGGNDAQPVEREPALRAPEIPAEPGSGPGSTVGAVEPPSPDRDQPSEPSHERDRSRPLEPSKSRSRVGRGRGGAPSEARPTAPEESDTSPSMSDARERRRGLPTVVEW